MTFRESEWGNGPGGLVYVTALALQRERDELEQEPEGRTSDYFFKGLVFFLKTKAFWNMALLWCNTHKLLP